MYTNSWIYCSFINCNFDLFYFAVLQCNIRIWWMMIVFVVYHKYFLLTTQNPHYRPYCTEIRNRILAHGRPDIYCAPIHIEVPFLGAHQPWYIESTQYCIWVWFCIANPCGFHSWNGMQDVQIETNLEFLCWTCFIHTVLCLCSHNNEILS